MAELPPTEEGARTDAAGDGRTQEEPAHRTPDESTVGLASSSQPTRAPQQGGGEAVELEIGETLAGRFTIVRFIARGGMGAVYEASDVLLRTRVAVKIIGGHLAADPTAMERFRREVLLARRVSHPNVCRVYELYETTTAKGIPIHFLTMELLEGESLARRLSRAGRMRTDEAFPIVKQMCEGLAAAHAEGVIHRDFKSSNVLLVPRAASDGGQTASSTRVVITDFGVARAIHLASENDASEGPLTGQGILGTPEYMAPEQVTGSEVTAATDVYALGVVLYEMVTGKLPFSGDTPLATAARRLNEAPPRPETSVPGLDRRWAAAIVRCLARQPERRFPSARDITPALDRPARARRAVIPAAVVAAILLVVGTYGLVKSHPSPRVREPEKQTAFAVPRRMVAVLGFRDEVKSPTLKWLPGAVTQLLTYEIAASESSLRATDVGPDRQSLGIAEDEVNDTEARKRLQAFLDADVLVYGTLSRAAIGVDDAHLRIEALDARVSKLLGTLEEDLGSGGERLVEALPALGTRLRNLLDVSLTAEEESALSASRAHNLDAVKLYGQGLMRSQLQDVEEARSHYEAAAAADSRFLLPLRALVGTWAMVSNRKNYLEGWKRIRALPGGLTTRQAAMIDSRLLIEENDDKATEAVKALFEATPDDFEIGSRLIARSQPRAKLAVIKRMQQFRAGPPLVLALREAMVVGGALDAHPAERLRQLAEWAQKLGARAQLARIRMLQAQRVPFEEPERRKEALALFAEAERLSTDVGLIYDVAEIKRQKAIWISGTGSRRDALAATDDAAGAYRRLGDREQVAHLLLLTAETLRSSGELSTARKKLEEARLELETIGSQPDGIMFNNYFQILAWQSLDRGDLDAAQEAIRRSRRCAMLPQWPPQIELLEARVLDEKDHREEARVAYGKGWSDPSLRVAGACTVECDGDHPMSGLECLTKSCRADEADFKGLQKASCQVEEAYCRLRANDLGGADKAAREAAAFLETRDYYELGLRNRAVLMRVAASRGESAKAIRTLRADLAKVGSEKNVRLTFETTLALGDVELRAGLPEGHARLAKLEQDARSREFFRIARLAREAMDGKPVTVAKPR